MMLVLAGWFAAIYETQTVRLRGCNVRGCNSDGTKISYTVVRNFSLSPFFFTWSFARACLSVVDEELGWCLMLFVNFDTVIILYHQ